MEETRSSTKEREEVNGPSRYLNSSRRQGRGGGKVSNSCGKSGMLLKAVLIIESRQNR